MRLFLFVLRFFLSDLKKVKVGVEKFAQLYNVSFRYFGEVKRGVGMLSGYFLFIIAFNAAAIKPSSKNPPNGIKRPGSFTGMFSFTL